MASRLDTQPCDARRGIAKGLARCGLAMVWLVCTQVVAQQATTTSLTAPSGPVPHGAPISLSAIAAASGAAGGDGIAARRTISRRTKAASSADGTMMFWHGTRLLGTSSVLVAHQGNVVTAGGGITLPPGTLPPGSHDLTAEFSGNTDLQGSTSSSKTLVVVSGSPVVSHPPPPTSPPPVVDYEYDAVGNLTALTQAKAVAGFGFVTRHTHDALGRHQNIVDPRLGHIGLGYRGGQRELAAVKDPRDLVTHYSRNGLGQSTRLSSPDTGSTDMLHDAACNLIASTDSRGVLTRIHYDAVNRPTSMVYTQPGTPDLAYAWTYDQTGGDFFRHGIGRLTTATFPEGSVQYAYDAHGRIAQVRQTLAAKAGVNPLPVVLTVGYTYNAAGRLASQTYPSGRKLVLDHTDGLPSTMSLAKDSSSPGTPLISNLQYAPFGPPVRWDWAMTTGPLAHVRELDVSGRVVRYRLGDHLRDIHYDAAGRITAYTHRSMGTGLAAPELDQQFGYDELGRIILVGTALNTWTYAYDATGNRTSVSLNGSPAAYAVDAASNRLNAVSSPPISFSHDAAGNITSDGHFTLAYDLRGRLTALSRPGQPTSSYAYDHAGWRVRKSSSQGSSSTVIFVYDNQGQLLGEYDSAGEAIREYVWLDDLPVAVVVPDPALGPSAAPLVYLVHADHLNTPRVVVDRAGAMRWRWLAEPFGTSTPETSPSGSAAFTYNLRFPGQFYDAESGVHQNVMRDYLPGVGRYAQSDPIGLAGGINTYAYVEGNPVSKIDPLGLETYLCRRPLDGFRGIAVGPLHHQFLCTLDAKGKVNCGGLGPRDGSSGMFGGQGVIEPETSVRPEQCEKVRDLDQCFEKCVNGILASSAPNYDVRAGRSWLFPSSNSQQCQVYAKSVLDKCSAQCRK